MTSLSPLRMETPLLSLTIDSDGRPYFPGETLQGEFQIDAVDPDDLRAVELSVMWRTEGKGDEDFGVHYFLRREQTDEGSPSTWRSFSTLLPETPLSYDGVIVKIQWLTRLRVSLRGGQDFIEEVPFRLGELPPATPVEPPVVEPTTNANGHRAVRREPPAERHTNGATPSATVTARTEPDR